MLQVRLTTPEGRKTEMAEPTQTIKTFLEVHEVELDGATVSLDGITLTHTEMCKTFQENFVEESCRLTVVIKSDNGVA